MAPSSETLDEGNIQLNTSLEAKKFFNSLKECYTGYAKGLQYAELWSDLPTDVFWEAKNTVNMFSPWVYTATLN